MTRRLAVAALLCVLTAPAPFAAAPRKLPGGPTVSANTFVIDTNLGAITVELDSEKAPLHAANFAKYADDGYFDGLSFHRVIPDFMVQTGGLDADMKQKKATYPQVKNESANGLKNLRGTLAAARTSDPDSATCQFFINLKDNAFLDGSAAKPGYSVFGKVTAGMDVVDQIAKVRTANKAGHGDVPVDPITIKSVKRATK
ncbi:MAG TPA: peptidylprolyl isomerase [Gemmataceae bacterium]|jgi:peptidyl-prolyl cis-trans isomerase A (cyclophilin A)|nr:peptidylprolyl isomerase [Gemmataceae bacterium]